MGVELVKDSHYTVTVDGSAVGLCAGEPAMIGTIDLLGWVVRVKTPWFGWWPKGYHEAALTILKAARDQVRAQEAA